MAFVDYHGCTSQGARSTSSSSIGPRPIRASNFSDLEGIESPRKAPEGTSIGTVSQALDILRRAALSEPIPREHGVALARAVMSSTALGRLCLAVLDEGQARALVELASVMCREIAGATPPDPLPWLLVEAGQLSMWKKAGHESARPFREVSGSAPPRLRRVPTYYPRPEPNVVYAYAR